MQYDAFARRIEKRVTSEGSAPSIAEYVWDGHQLLHEIGPSDTVTWHWDPESFAPVMHEENGRLASITTDHLGTPTEMYDEMGAPIWKARPLRHLHHRARQSRAVPLPLAGAVRG